MFVPAFLQGRNTVKQIVMAALTLSLLGSTAVTAQWPAPFEVVLPEVWF
jgi:hypothetical protein